jgi:predicted HicB family RNase H-like nuclease
VINQMIINGVSAIVTYDPDMDLFRGEFTGLAGGADFYASDIEGLKREGAVSLKVYLDACKEDGAEPFKSYTGKFMLRTDPSTHAAAIQAAAASGKSLNQFVVEAIKRGLEEIA